jgi:RNA polymerase sigma factor (sigma-70 family)
MDPLTHPAPVSEEFLGRLESLALETKCRALRQLERRIREGGPEACQDLLNTTLMDLYRRTGNSAAFAFLYEMNAQRFFFWIVQRLRRTGFALDPADVLQEVFFNIYRYPHRFLANQADAFRHWTGRILRNTLLKQWRSRSRSFGMERPDEDLAERPDRRAVGPMGEAIRRESERTCSIAYVLCLVHYLHAYRRLSPRERRALHLVEVKERSYREAAEVLGIRLENLKMVIFRARKKIFRSLDRVFATPEGLQAHGDSR